MQRAESSNILQFLGTKSFIRCVHGCAVSSWRVDGVRRVHMSQHRVRTKLYPVSLDKAPQPPVPRNASNMLQTRPHPQPQSRRDRRNRLVPREPQQPFFERLLLRTQHIRFRRCASVEWHPSGDTYSSDGLVSSVLFWIVRDFVKARLLVPWQLELLLNCQALAQ